jgi:hypothetical protein
MNQAANSIGLRKARYRGQKKIELEHYIGATAITITRLDAYFSHQLLDHTHASRLTYLHAATTNERAGSFRVTPGVPVPPLQ